MTHVYWQSKLTSGSEESRYILQEIMSENSRGEGLNPKERESSKQRNQFCRSDTVIVGLLPKRSPLLDHMLHVCMFRCVQLDVVLGQDLHDRPDLQPPLGPGDAVPGVDRPELTPHSDNTEHTDEQVRRLTQSLCLPSAQREAGT